MGQSRAMRTKKEPPSSRRRGCTLTLYQRINKDAWLSSGCRIPNLAHSSFFSLCESGGGRGAWAGFSCPCADTKRLLIKSALADSLLIRVCGVTARARTEIVWRGLAFLLTPEKNGGKPVPDGELKEEGRRRHNRKKKGALDYRRPTMYSHCMRVCKSTPPSEPGPQQARSTRASARRE